MNKTTLIGKTMEKKEEEKKKIAKTAHRFQFRDFFSFVGGFGDFFFHDWTQQFVKRFTAQFVQRNRTRTDGHGRVACGVVGH